MAEYTQEQLEQLIAEKVAEARTGLFTEEDLNRKVTAEVDRRVESGIQKGLETQRQKWEQEFTEKAKMSAEERAKAEFEEQLKLVTSKEQEIKRRANQLEAKSMLADADVPKSHYEKFIAMLVSDDEELTKSNVQNFIDMFNSTKSEIETKVKSEFSKVPPPNTGAGNEGVTKADFDKMGYADKMKFKMTNPEQYKEFIRN